MNIYVIDTDHVSLFQRNHPFVVQHWAEANPDSLAVTIITVEEQIRGRFASIKQAKSKAKIVQAYTNLQTTVTFFNTIKVLSFDETAFAHDETLKKQKIRIGRQDLRIAAIALAINAIVVTRNQKDFSKVPNLILEDCLGFER